MDQAIETRAPIPPERARRQDMGGHPVRLADGNEWLLAPAGLAPVLTEIRDRMYDLTLLRGSVRMGDVLQAAWVCLMANYDLADREIEALLTGCDEAALASAVLDAVLGPEMPARTYTTWAMSALLANGVDPAAVPAHLVDQVLDQLVRTGRAVPQGEFIDAAIGAAKRQGLLNMAQKLGTKAK